MSSFIFSEAFTLKAGVSVIATCMVTILGGFDHLLMSLVALVCLDYFSGVLAAITQHRLSSSVGFKGIATKIGVFVLVATASLLDQAMLLTDPVIRSIVIFFFIVNESVSILENATILGVPIPPGLTKVLAIISSDDPDTKEAK